MIESRHIITRELNGHFMPIARAHAKRACVGGKSNIRSGDDRAATLSEDQLVGQLGAMAGCLYMYGNIERYMTTRFYANQNPDLGDGGFDIPGLNVDFKASLMRASVNPLDYKLVVRPRERHEGWIYFLVLIENITEVSALTHMVGWFPDDELPTPSTGGVFSGAHVVGSHNLYRLPPHAWKWF